MGLTFTFFLLFRCFFISENCIVIAIHLEIVSYLYCRNMYKGIRHCVRWGDLLPVMDEKKPRKVITFENEIVVNKDD